MKNPLFSILIPCYNSEKYLNECIQSVLNQNFLDFEIICVNDGSKDRTYDILKKWGKQIDKIQVINSKHRGVSAARNLLIKKAKGKYYVFLDSDDIMCENLLSSLAKHTNKDIDCFVGKFEGFCQDGTTNLISGLEIDSKKINCKSQRQVFLHFRNVKIINAVCRFVIKADIIRNNKIYFHEGIVHEDEEWVTKVLLECKSFYSLPQPHFLYRRHRNSIMSNMNIFNYECKITVAQELLKYSRKFKDYKKDFILLKVARICKEVYYSLMEGISNE